MDSKNHMCNTMLAMEMLFFSWKWFSIIFVCLHLEGDGVGVEKLSLYIIHEHDWKDVITQTVEIKNLLTFPIFTVVFTKKMLFLPPLYFLFFPFMNDDFVNGFWKWIPGQFFRDSLDLLWNLTILKARTKHTNYN